MERGTFFIHAILDRIHARLVIIDPLVAYLGKGVTAYRGQKPTASCRLPPAAVLPHDAPGYDPLRVEGASCYVQSVSRAAD